MWRVMTWVLLSALSLGFPSWVTAQGTTINGSRGITGSLGLGTGTAPATAGTLNQIGGANGATLQTLKRATDSSPSGDFALYQNAAGGTLWEVDITGNLAAGTVPFKRITRVVTAVATATTLPCNVDTSDVCTQANTQGAGTLTIPAPGGTPSNWQAIQYRVTCTNAQTYSFDASFGFSTDIPAPTTCAAGKTDYFGARWNSTASKWQVLGVVQGF